MAFVILSWSSCNGLEGSTWSIPMPAPLSPIFTSYSSPLRSFLPNPCASSLSLQQWRFTTTPGSCHWPLLLLGPLSLPVHLSWTSSLPASCSLLPVPLEVPLFSGWSDPITWDLDRDYCWLCSARATSQGKDYKFLLSIPATPRRSASFLKCPGRQSGRVKVDSLFTVYWELTVQTQNPVSKRFHDSAKINVSALSILLLLLEYWLVVMVLGPHSVGPFFFLTFSSWSILKSK